MTVGELIDVLKTFKQDDQVYYADSEYGGFILDAVIVAEIKKPMIYYFDDGNKVTKVAKGVVIY